MRILRFRDESQDQIKGAPKEKARRGRQDLSMWPVRIFYLHCSQIEKARRHSFIGEKSCMYFVSIRHQNTRHSEATPKNSFKKYDIMNNSFCYLFPLYTHCVHSQFHVREPIQRGICHPNYMVCFFRTRNLNLSLGVLNFFAYFRLKSSYFVLNFFQRI